MKESTQNLVKAGLATYYTGVAMMIVGLAKHGVDTVLENRKSKKAAEKAAAE